MHNMTVLQLNLKIAENVSESSSPRHIKLPEPICHSAGDEATGLGMEGLKNGQNETTCCFYYLAYYLAYWMSDDSQCIFLI